MSKLSEMPAITVEQITRFREAALLEEKHRIEWENQHNKNLLIIKHLQSIKVRHDMLMEGLEELMDFWQEIGMSVPEHFDHTTKLEILIDRVFKVMADTNAGAT